MDEVAVGKRQRVVAQNVRVETIGELRRDGFAILDEGPIRLRPYGIDDLPLNLELSTGRVEDPDPLPGDVHEPRAAASRADRLPHDLLAVHEIEPVVARVDDDVD